MEQTFQKINNFISQMGNNVCSKKEIEDISIDLKDILLSADVPYDYTMALIADMRKKLSVIKDKKLDKSAVIGGLLQSYIAATFDNTTCSTLNVKNTGITTIGVFGPNGVGKTSFVAKLAHLLQNKYHKRAMCVSFDNTRFAAQEQLKILCQNNNIEYFNAIESGMAVGIKKLKEIIDYEVVDILIVDHAGVSPDDRDGTQVWTKVLNEINFDDRIVILDGTCGQNAVDLVRKYDAIVNITGFAVSKVDSDQKGGVFFAIAFASKKPIYYISCGEKIDKIYEFNKRMISEALLNVGGLKDVIASFRASNKEYIRSLIEKNKSEGLNYNDLLQQLTKLVSFGKLDKVLSVLPHTKSFFNIKLSTEAYIIIKKWISIIMSMTPFERTNIKCLNIDRINRIAKGAGVSVAEVITLQKKIAEINKLQY